MNITPLSGLPPPEVTGGGARTSFAQTMAGETQAAKVATPQSQQQQTTASAQTRVEGSPCSNAAAPLSKVEASALMSRVHQAQTRMDQVLAMAESGKVFSPAELLSLQAQVYRASQELDLAGKVVEKATGGVKQVLQTQL